VKNNFARLETSEETAAIYRCKGDDFHAPIGDNAMIDEPTKSDLAKAYQILSEFGLLIGPAGKSSDAIARAIAAGIALGRKEALTTNKQQKKG
jgi:hypothetical protein